MANNIESTVKDTWKSVLNVDKATEDENFFELGGTSVLAMQLLFKLSDSLGTSISEARFLEKPTINTLMGLLSE